MAQAVQESANQQQPEVTTPEQKCNQALILNMNEVLKDKVQQIVKKTVGMVEMYQSVLGKHKNVNPKQDTSNFEKFMMNFLEKLADSKSAPGVHRVYLGFCAI